MQVLSKVMSSSPKLETNKTLGMNIVDDLKIQLIIYRKPTKGEHVSI